MLYIIILLSLFFQYSFAEKRLLIDFSKFDYNISEIFPYKQTEITRDENGYYKVIKPGVDYFLLSAWQIDVKFGLSHSQYKKYSYNGSAIISNNLYMASVINFPDVKENIHSIIKPLYPFHSFNSYGKFLFINNGILANIGEIKEIKIRVRGLTNDFHLFINLRDSKGKITEYFMGNLNFEGERVLVWKNNSLITPMLYKFPDKTKIDLNKISYISLDSIRLTKTKYAPGGTFSLYIRNIEIDYYPDYIVEKDFSDEEIYNFLNEKNIYTRNYELDKIYEDISLREIEKKKMYDSIDSKETNIITSTGDEF